MTNYVRLENLSLGLAIVFSTAWLLLNHAVPIWDGAEFVVSGQKIAEAYRTLDFENILNRMYYERGWRPLIWPLLASPFFYLMNNQISAATMAIQTILFIVFTAYVFKITSIYLIDKKAKYASSFVMLVPWVFNASRDYYPDFLLITFFVAFIYYFLIAVVHGRELSARQRILAVLAVFLCFAARPVEASIYVAVFGLAVLVSRDYELFNRRVLFNLAISICLFALTIVVVPVAQRVLHANIPIAEQTLFVVLCLIFAASAIYGFLKRDYSNFYFLFSLGLFFSTLWYFGLRYPLIDWAYTTSFGSLAATTDRRSEGKAIFEILSMVSQPFGKNFYGLLGALFIAAVVSRIQFVLPELKKHRVLVVFSVISFVFIMVLYSLSGTGDHRRTMVPLMLVTVFAVIVISRTALWPLIAGWASVLVVGLGISVAAPLTAGANGFEFRAIFDYRVPTPGPDVNRMFARKLLTLFDGTESRISFHTICYFDNDAGCSARKIPWVEPLALTAATQESRKYVFFHFKNDLDGIPDEKLARVYRDAGFTHMLLDLFDKPLSVNTAIDHNRATLRLLELARNGGLNKHFRFVGNVEFGGRNFAWYAFPAQ